DGIQPGHIFPFLAPFLMDADHLWRAQGTGPLKSGSWRAIDSIGQDYALEASAMCLGKHQILCLALSHIVFSLGGAEDARSPICCAVGRTGHGGAGTDVGGVFPPVWTCSCLVPVLLP